MTISNENVFDDDFGKFLYFTKDKHEPKKQYIYIYTEYTYM